MKKTYQKPEAILMSFSSEEEVTAIEVGSMGEIENPEGWD